MHPENVQIFVYNCVFRKKEKQPSQNLSQFHIQHISKILTQIDVNPDFRPRGLDMTQKFSFLTCDPSISKSSTSSSGGCVMHPEMTDLI